MLKKDLLNLINSLTDEQEVDETLKDSELVKKFSNLDVFKEKFNTDKDFKAFMDSEKDKHSAKSLDTWRTNNLQKLIDEAVSKANPKETPEQKEIRELKEKFARKETEELKQKLMNKALLLADEKNLPKGLLNYFIGEDEDSTTNNLKTLEETWMAELKKGVDAGVEERFKDNSYIPPSKTNDKTGTSNNFIDIIKENQSKR